jgi:cytochrome P450
VIIETLRLYPPFTGLPFKTVPPQGDTIDGKHVPGGTLISPNFCTTGRNRAVFGEDADVFRPERWLEADAAAAASGDRERRAEMRRVAELTFGYGRWGCAGKMIAFLELNKIFVEVSSLLSPSGSGEGYADGLSPPPPSSCCASSTSSS